MKGLNKNKVLAFTVALLVVAAGTYNTILIGSNSELSGSDMRFVKRLDEINGVTIPGRNTASVKWKKLGSTQKIAKSIPTTEEKEISETPVSVESIPAPAVEETLTLSLVEVINQTKWQNGLSDTQFSGSLEANNGVIEELNVALPNGEGVSVSFSEMTGNVFQYDLNGELQTGMLYQVDRHAYMVTLTSGPLEGTRLRFSSQTQRETEAAIQNSLADNNIEVGTFGADLPVQPVQETQEDMVQAQGFNFDRSRL